LDIDDDAEATTSEMAELPKVEGAAEDESRMEEID
jgi:hypothetical protein